MTDEERDRRINSALNAFDELAARQEAIEYLAVEMIAARFDGLSQEAIANECDRLRHKLRNWPPVWPRQPIAVEDRDTRIAALDHAVGQMLRRAAERAHQIAITGGRGGAG